MQLKKIQRDLKILANDEIAKDTYKMTLDATLLDTPVEPGTFFNLTVPNQKYILKRPISIFSVEPKNQTISLIYKIMGDGTRAFSKMVAGNRIEVMGPLGSGFPIQDDSQAILLIGGGVGVPPLYELGCRLKAAGKQVTAVLGFRDRESVFCEADFKKLGDTIICTDDGSYGYHGLVTAAIRHHELQFDTLYACGPALMLKSVDMAYRDSKVGYLSFEERMACGIGACYGCMTPTKEGLKRVCKDGPVFKLGEAVDNG